MTDDAARAMADHAGAFDLQQIHQQRHANRMGGQLAASDGGWIAATESRQVDDDALDTPIFVSRPLALYKLMITPMLPVMVVGWA